MLNFLGIGAQKCGTTWLFENLNRHPDILFPLGKEVHFWDGKLNQDIEWYRQSFPDIRGKISGEITPAYAILPPAVIEEIHHRFPKLKLIYIIRDPVERAWSGALMALGRAEMTVEEASDQWFIDHFNSQGSRLRTDYGACIANWQRFYPARQILILRYEDIATMPRQLLKRCAMHLKVKSKFFDTVDEKDLKEKIYAGPGYMIRPSLRAVLEEMYRDNIWYKM